MFVKHIIKTLHVSVTIVWPSSVGRLSCLVLLLLLCLFASFNDANKHSSSNSTKHERRPPEDGQTIVTETCRVLMMCFTNIFNNLVF